MKKKVYLIFNIILGVFLISVPIYAWLVELKSTDEIILKSGKVEYLFTGEIETGLIVPGQNLIKEDFVIENKSTVNSQLRIMISITLDGELLSSDDERLLINLGLGEDFVLREDRYYYYQNKEGIMEPSYTEPIMIIDDLTLNGYFISNDYSNKEIQIKITIQAKQADYVSWDTLLEEEINFETGD